MSDALTPHEESAPLLSSSELKARIERLNISADAKSLLFDLAKLTIEIGGKLVNAGRKILSVVFDLVHRFPNTTFGIIAAYVVTALLASVPLLGPALGAIVGPLLLAMGIAGGALADLKERAVVARVERLEQELNGTGQIRA